MSDYIPVELVRDILLKLPVKSVIKCTSVCKSWRSMIKSSPFIQSHLCSTIHSNNENDTHLLLLSAGCVNHKHRHWLHWDTPEFGEYSVLSNPPCDFSDPDVIGTCNGLVCFDHKPYSDVHSFAHFPAFIWNPSIKKIVILPRPPGPDNERTSFYEWSRRYNRRGHPCEVLDTNYDKYASHSFGYDSHSGDYKVLRIVARPIDYRVYGFATEVQVYSLASGSWKNLSAAVAPPHLSGCGAGPPFVNGKLHFLEACVTVFDFYPEQEFRMDGGSPRIASFDLSTELFGEIMMPKGLEKDPCKILKYRECLALARSNGVINLADCGYDIWVMEEYGVMESWTCLYKIALVDTTSIYGFKRCGQVLLNETKSRDESRMLWYDPKSKQCEVFRSDCESDAHVYYFFESFVGSLVLLDHPNAISYPEP